MDGDGPFIGVGDGTDGCVMVMAVVEHDTSECRAGGCVAQSLVGWQHSILGLTCYSGNSNMAKGKKPLENGA